AMGMTVAAVMQARRDGVGARLDISQREVTTFLIGETVAAALASPKDRRIAPRRGNADPAGGRRGCVPTADERWLAVEIPDGGPDVAAVATTVRGMGQEEALAWARAAGVAATPVLTGAEALAIARGGGGQPVGHAFAADPTGRLAKGFPFRSRDCPFRIRNSAPLVGQDTDATLERLLGLDEDARRRLRSDGVI
ncbi:MAG: CoA transferase, partial [Alphaproteobacteria bacterium]